MSNLNVRLDDRDLLVKFRTQIGDDPRNPVRQALAAVGSVVGGLGPSQDTWDEVRTEDRFDVGFDVEHELSRAVEALDMYFTSAAPNYVDP